MIPDDWRKDFYERLEEVRSGLYPRPSTSLPVETGGSRSVDLKQLSPKDLSNHVYLAEHTLMSAFRGMLTVAVDTGRYAVPLTGKRLDCRKAVRFFNKDDILGLVTDAPLERGCAGLGARGWFVVTINHSPSREAFQRTVVHEAGHAFGLGHCQDKECIMSTNGKRADRFCESCTLEIRRELGWMK